MKRALGLLAGVLILSLSEPAWAQEEDYERTVTVMRACSQIEDITARVTCYDNNIVPRETPAPSDAVAQPGPKPAAAAGGFGSESLPVKPSVTREGQVQEVELRVRSAAEREPGVYLLTLDGGARWLFVDSAPATYHAPKRGATVSIRRGLVGGFLMRYDGQASVRVKRVR